MITRQEYQKALQIVKEYEFQVKNNSELLQYSNYIKLIRIASDDLKKHNSLTRTYLVLTKMYHDPNFNVCCVNDITKEDWLLFGGEITWKIFKEHKDKFLKEYKNE